MGKYIDLCDIQDVTGTVYTNNSTPSSTQMYKYIEYGESKFESEVGSFVVPDEPDVPILKESITSIVSPHLETISFDLADFCDNFEDIEVYFTNPVTSEEVVLNSENTTYDSTEVKVTLVENELTIESKEVDLVFDITVSFIKNETEFFVIDYTVEDLAVLDIQTQEEEIIEYTNFLDIVDGYSFGIWLKDRIPLKKIVSIETNIGNRFDLKWSERSTKYYISNKDIGKVQLPNPIIGERQYRVSGVYGYEKNELPSIIKQLVMLYIFREYFKSEFFNKKTADVTETIDVDVYREVTRGGSILNGMQGINELIEFEKRNLKNRLTTQLL